MGDWVLFEPTRAHVTHCIDMARLYQSCIVVPSKHAHRIRMLLTPPTIVMCGASAAHPFEKRSSKSTDIRLTVRSREVNSTKME